jgi:hypothetical protein
MKYFLLFQFVDNQAKFLYFYDFFYLLFSRLSFFLRKVYLHNLKHGDLGTFIDLISELDRVHYFSFHFVMKKFCYHEVKSSPRQIKFAD